MDTETPLTPDVDLPGQQGSQADLDIDVEPEPAQDEGASQDDAAAGAADDPELGNTLIRPDNS